MEESGYKAAFRDCYNLLKEYAGRTDENAWEELAERTIAIYRKSPQIEWFIKSLNCAVLNEIARRQGK